MKRKIKLSIGLLLIAGIALAQERGIDQRVDRHLQKLTEQVELTETQRSELEPVLKASAEEIKILRQSGEANKSAIKEIKQSQKSAIKSVLTVEQNEKLEAIRVEKKESHKAIRSDIRAYNKLHVKPIIKEKRAGFENSLSADEKAIIDEVRAMRPSKEHRKKGLTDTEKAEMKTLREEMHVMLQPILDNHSEELKTIKTELEPVMLEARQHASEMKKEHEMKKSKGEKSKKSKHFEYRFLLMKG